MNIAVPYVSLAAFPNKPAHNFVTIVLMFKKHSFSTAVFPLIRSTTYVNEFVFIMI